MDRRQAIETARAVLDGTNSRADTVALALYVLSLENEGAFSPSASSSGGGANPAAPVSAPVSTQSLAASPARHLGSPSGFPPKEVDTKPDLRPSSSATVPTIAPMAGMAWQEEKIALWLESHARGYEHGGYHDSAQTLRKKAMQIRRREYLEDRR